MSGSSAVMENMPLSIICKWCYECSQLCPINDKTLCHTAIQIIFDWPMNIMHDDMHLASNKSYQFFFWKTNQVVI